MHARRQKTRTPPGQTRRTFSSWHRRRLELRVCASFARPPTPAGGNVELAQVLYMQWVFVTNEEHRVQELSLLKGLLAKLPSLYCPGQNTHPSSVPEKDTIFTLPGCLLYKYS